MKLGVKPKEIFCSSVPGYGIPFGKNIISTLHNQFDNYKLFVIFIHSPRYYKSVVSLNEMGAAWILRAKHRSFLTSDCEFSLLTGVVNSDEIAFKAGMDETEHLLHDFRYDIKEFFSLDKIPDAVWESVKKEFIEKVKSFSYQSEKIETGKKASTAIKQTITDNEKLVIGYLKQEGKEMRLSDISANIGLSIHTTLRILRKLIDEEIIVPTGAGKYGKYRLA